MKFEYSTTKFRYITTILMTLICMLLIFTGVMQTKIQEKLDSTIERIDVIQEKIDSMIERLDAVEDQTHQPVEVKIIEVPEIPQPTTTADPVDISEEPESKPLKECANEDFCTGDWKTAELTEDDIYYLAWITQAEAEDEPEIGQRLVIDVILNRVESTEFPNSVYGVIFDGHQFSPTFDGRLNSVKPTERLMELVMEEAAGRLNSEALYFRSGHYHNFGTRLFSYGGHYFSK